MQRWLLIGGAALLLLFGIGLPTAYHLYKQGRPHPVWLPIPLNPEAPYAETQRIVHSLDAKLSDRKNLIHITREVDLKSKWDMSDDEQVVDEILARLYVKQGDMETPMGKVPAIHVGLRGTNRDREVSYALLDALLPDVWKVLGIDPPKKP